MTKKVSVLVALFCVIGGASGLAMAQTPIMTTRYVTAEASKAEGASVSTKSNSELAREVESLRHRVEDLESQNRALAELLSAVKTKLDSMSDPPPDERRAAVVRPGAAALPRAASIENAAARASADSRTGPPATEQPVQSKPDSGEPLHWSDLLGDGNQLKFYGFLRLDLDVDSQRANNDQTPLFITSADPRIGKPGAGDFSMHPRLTRFGVDYCGPRIAALGDSKLSGKLELDFENGGSESRQIIRIRHGYLKMDWDHQVSILAGQTWDLVSPL
ncbi:MAG TPA: hypothetical protein VKG02_06380, partial [Blastocatellia bacterium]|nr:hypothetical protein [Blastocatellia bacterium]